MPFLAMQDEDEQLRRQQLKPGATNVAGTPGAAMSTASGMPTTAPGGNFVNLMDYMKANEGAGQQMAGKVTADVEKSAKAAGAGPLKPQVQQAGMQLNDAATGFHQAQQQAAADETESKARLLGTPGGQTRMLDKLYGSGRTTGESALDNALLGAGGGGRLGELSRKYQGLSSMVTQQQAAGNKATQQRYADEKERANLEMQDANSKKVLARRDAEAAAQSKASNDATALEMAKKSGYHGDDVEGARVWYRQMFNAELP